MSKKHTQPSHGDGYPPIEVRQPGVIVFGEGALERLGPLAAGQGSRALLVTGASSMRRAGFLERARSSLSEAGLSVDVFGGVSPEPSTDEVDSLRDEIARFGADLIVGMGGGSALDVGKAAAALGDAPLPTEAYFGGKPMPNGSALPLIAIPSTFGTGTEATIYAVLRQKGGVAKHSLSHPAMMPRVALVDPDLGAGTPQKTRARSGLDAWTQAVESHLSRSANATTRALSEAALLELAHGLPTYLADGSGSRNSSRESSGDLAEERAARRRCARGSLLAGMAFQNAGLGLVHGLAHPLGGHSGIAHGEICAILLPHALEFNGSACGPELERLAGLLGRDLLALTTDLLHASGLPTDLTHLGLSSSLLGSIAEQATTASATRCNPRAATAEDLVGILDAATSRRRE